MEHTPACLDLPTMSQRLRIIAADDDPFIQEYYEQVFPALGHELLAVVDSGWELIEKCHELRPDLVITDIKMPDMDGIDAAHKLYWEQPVPVIIVSGFHDEDLIERATAEHILAYLVKPVTMERLRTEIQLAMRRFGEFEIVLAQSGDLRQALKDRKVVERAKARMMKNGLDEPQAFQQLKQSAADNALTVVETAKSVLDGEKAVS